MSNLDDGSRPFDLPRHGDVGQTDDPWARDAGAESEPGHDLLHLAQSLNRVACAALRRERDLKRVNQYKSHVLALASHDLRQPLQVIRDCLEHLIARMTSGAAARHVAGAREAIMRLEQHMTLCSKAAAYEIAGPAASLALLPRGAAPLAHGAVDATVFVIDHDGAVRATLRDLFRLQSWIVRAYASVEEFLSVERGGDRWGCLVVEVRPPGTDVLGLLSTLQAEAFGLPVIMMMSCGDVRLAVEATRAGAADCIQKPIRPDAILACVAQALERARGRAALPGPARARSHRIATLTARERQIMDLVVAGHANKEIAARVAISQRTVEKHRAAVMKKAGAESLADLIRIGLAMTGGPGEPARTAQASGVPR